LTRLEKLAKGKHSSLLREFEKYGQKLQHWGEVLVFMSTFQTFFFITEGGTDKLMFVHGQYCKDNLTFQNKARVGIHKPSYEHLTKNLLEPT
jgi:hypothetical protein